MTHTVQLLRHDAYNCTYNYKRMTCATVKLRLKSGLLMTNQIREFYIVVITCILKTIALLQALATVQCAWPNNGT